MRTLFSNHGAVLHVRIIQDRETGQSKGYGFVTMGAPNMAQVRDVLPRLLLTHSCTSFQ